MARTELAKKKQRKAGASIIGAAGATGFLSSLLYGLKANDELTLVSVSVVLTAVAPVASFIPARQATKVDPIVSGTKSVFSCAEPSTSHRRGISAGSIKFSAARWPRRHDRNRIRSWTLRLSRSRCFCNV